MTTATKFEKKVIEPGVFNSPDGTVVVTPDRISKWKATYDRMRSVGLQIPIPWDHQDGATPTADPNPRSKLNAGFVDDMVIRDDGALYAICDIPLDEDRARIGTTVREVSPEIQLNFVDGLGNVYDDAITHVALVTMPVQPGQSNFQPIPENTLRFSLENKSVRMGKFVDEDDFDDDDDDDDDDFDDDDDDDFDDDDDDDFDDDDDDDDEIEAMKSECIKNLEQLGIALPVSTALEDFLPHLLVALRTKIHNDNMMKGNDMDQQAQNLEVQNMSLTVNPLFKHLADRAENGERARLSLRVDNLLKSGRITPDIAKNLRAEIQKYRLSLTPDGKSEPTQCETKIEAYEQLPESIAFQQGSKFELALNPETTPTEEEQKEKQAIINRLVGVAS